MNICTRRESFHLFKSYLKYNFRNVSNNSSSDEVIFETNGNKGIIRLNRPKDLNALNLSMIRKIYPQLKSWENDNDINLIIIKGEGEKAFCAGGDVKAIAQSGKGSSLCEEFFREEYRLNHMIGSLSKPYIALINGICMGGGVGLSIHGHIRVVTEKAMFSMPETRIGFFTDVGGSHFLPKLSGQLGLFLGLTGHKLVGRDIFKAGLATHFIPSNKLNDLEQELLRFETPKSQYYYKNIIEIITKYQKDWEIDYRTEFSLKKFMGRINNCFGETQSVEQIITKLNNDKSDWAKNQIEILSQMSPTSLKVTFELLKRGHNSTLAECLKMEFRLSQNFMANEDFFSGVKALLIEKNQTPVWKPSTLEEVTDESIQSYFAPLSGTNKELKF